MNNEKPKISDYFESFIKKTPIFLDKKVLQAPYMPENIPHRDNEVQKIANILAPVLRMEKPSNLFIYGKTGTGKTLSVKHVSNEILKIAQRENINVKIFYINCKLKKVTDTEYRLLAHLVSGFGKEIPPTGLPTDEVYNIFFKLLDSEKQLVILVLDEIDQLYKTGNEILYNLTRINSELKNSQLSIVGISNDLTFTDSLDPRVKSSLSEEEIIFPPYNAIQLQDILFQRAKYAFRENSITEGVIHKCAAYAAREHGDARRALELLRVAGELAEREGSDIVQLKHIDEAEEKIEKDRVIDITKTQPKQFQATLFAILSIENKQKNDKLSKHNKPAIYTGDVYDLYKSICDKIGLRPLTQRRVSDILAELDMMGIINAKVISYGRYGRTREITVSLSQQVRENIEKNLKQELHL